MRRVLIIFALLGIFTMLIGAGCADSERALYPIIIIAVGIIVTAFSTIGLKVRGELDDN